MQGWQGLRPTWATLMTILFALVWARTAAAEEPPPVTHALRPVEKFDLAKAVNEACGPAPAANVAKALGCGAFWQAPATKALEKAGAPFGAFKPRGRPLCTEVAELNGPTPHDKGLSELIRACGFRQNPRALVDAACADLETKNRTAASPEEITALRDKITAIGGRAKLKPAEEKELKDARNRLAAAKAASAYIAYYDGLGCKERSWKPSPDDAQRWSGRREESPWNKAGDKRLCDVAHPGAAPPGDVPAAKQLYDVCQAAGERAGATFSPAEALAMTVVQGFGDFLKSRAKEELIDFAVEQLGRQFCDCDAPGKITGTTLFPKTCGVIFPKATLAPACSLGDANIEGITSGEFQKVFIQELGELPGRIIGLMPIWDTIYDDKTQGQALRSILAHTANMLLTLTRYDQNYLVFFKNLEEAVRAEVGDKGSLQCNFSPAKAPTAPCVLTLMLAVAGTASVEIPNGVANATPDRVKLWLEHASGEYCKHYGARSAAGDRPTDGSCVLGADAEVWEQIQSFITGMDAFHKRMAEVHDAVAQAQKSGKFPLEIAALALPEVADAVAALDDTIIKVLKVVAPKEGLPADKLDKVVRALDLVGQTLKVVSAGVKQDYRAIAGAMRVIVTVDLIQGEVNPALKKGLLFACDLADAKTADDARKVFEDYAAPRDTYRAKYGTMKHLVTLNAYVGFFGMVKAPLVHASAGAGYKSPDQTWVSPLSAPFGVDWTIPIGPQSKAHVGFLFSILDPLEMRTTDANGTTTADFSGILAPGAFFRVGMWKSPVALMVGARVQPLLKSADTCGSSSCWQAPISGLVGLAVDVPVLPLGY